MQNWERFTLKERAKEELKISYLVSLCASLVFYLLMPSFDIWDNHYSYFNISSFFIYGLGGLMAAAYIFRLAYYIFIYGPIRVGLARFFVQAAKGERTFFNLFSALFSSSYINIVITMAIYSLIIYVGLCLLIVPGIILYYMFRMVPYILAQDPDIPAVDALKMSYNMTYGEKLNMFVLDLSFIGWFLLGAMLTGLIELILGGGMGIGIALMPILRGTMGIGIVLVIPYYGATYAQLYGALMLKLAGKDPYEGSGYSGGYNPAGQGFGGGSGYNAGHGSPTGGYSSSTGGYKWGGMDNDYGAPTNNRGNGAPPPPPYGRYVKNEQAEESQDKDESLEL